MKKSESKYFHTARLMDEALFVLLEKRDFELITVKDICVKAGVNRSTFYLHYENTYDLLKECIERLNQAFSEKFKETKLNVSSPDLNELVLINEAYLAPYLEFVEENKNVFRCVHDHPDLFDSANAYRAMFETVFDPILKRFGFSGEDNVYIMEYYGHGLSALVMKWVAGGCKEEKEKIMELIIQCVRPQL